MPHIRWNPIRLMIRLPVRLRWGIAAVLGLALFLAIQVFPVAGGLFTGDSHPVLSRAQARAQALAIASGKFGIGPEDVRSVRITHMTDSAATGYLSKTDRVDEYNKTWDARYPTDVYRADIGLADGSGLRLSLQMESGALVAWRHTPATAGLGDRAGGRPQAAPYDAAAAERALRWAEGWGVRPSDWEFAGSAGPGGEAVFQSRKPGVGEARWQLLIRPPAAETAAGGAEGPAQAGREWRGAAIDYRIHLPADYTAYIKKQNALADRLSVFGFIVPELVLFVLAVVYAAVYSKWTSFRRGWFLAAVFFLFYTAITFNMRAGFRAQAADTGLPLGEAAVSAVMLVNVVIQLGMAGLTYFAAVGGDGLWRSMGYRLWPSWREPGYGGQVLRSMGLGYLLACILLGAQSAVLFALERMLGSFASSDATQSIYNLSIPWLLPLLAWCAGISEELQTRFFAVGLFRRWLIGGARGLLRREPSRKAALRLTVAAMLPANLVWAFGHVGYAVYPVATRLIELMVMGLLFGWFMIRFGLMAAMFAHITVDSALMGVEMAYDGLPGNAWGALSVAAPALAGLAIWALRRSIRPKSGTTGKPV